MRYTVCLTLLALLLISCSDSSSSDAVSVNNALSVYSTVEELPPCTAANEGEQLFVKSEGIVRVCADEKWFATISPVSSCTTEPLADQSGVKIICNGDSVGVVLNGKNGSNGVNGRNGINGTNGYVINVGGDTADVVLDSEKVATSLEGVNGFSQKGPFLNGSKVNVLELESGRTLYQTGYTFKAEIKNDSGHFHLNARTMVSQYVELHAEGYYRNEVTGNNSEAPLTLYALTDVRKRDGGLVNINLLTHLEYHRVIYLVKEKKMKVSAAKDSAEKEVFKLIGVDSKDFASSEDLDITGSSEGDAALLAISVLLQGDRTVAQLTELLANISEDMEEDGTWDDAKTKKEIAEWAAEADLGGILDSVEKHVKKWNISSKVPDFKSHIRHFWQDFYKLDPCGTGLVGTIATSYNTDYICLDSADVGFIWRKATTYERDINGWQPADDGTFRTGVSGMQYVYDAVEGRWREPGFKELDFGLCTAAIEADPVNSVQIEQGTGIYYLMNLYYVCENRQWVGKDVYYVDTRYWEIPENGTIRKGSYSGGVYVYDKAFVYVESVPFWRYGWEIEDSLDVACLAENYAKVERLLETNGSYTYYACKQASPPDMINGYNRPKGNGNNDPHNVQTPYRWSKIDPALGANTYGLDCDEDGKMVNGVINTASYFVCEDDFWRVATEDELQMGSACTAKTAYRRVGDYVCENGAWRSVNYCDFDENEFPAKYLNSTYVYETLNDNRDGKTYKTVTIGGKTWMAQNLNFAGGEGYFMTSSNNGCYKDAPINCNKEGRTYTWAAAMNLPSSYDAQDAGNLIGENHQGICPEGWHIPSEVEFQQLIADVGDFSSYSLVAQDQPGWQNVPASSISRYGEITNSTGFSAIGSCSNPTTIYFISSNEYAGYTGTGTFGLTITTEYSGYTGALKSSRGFVRCVMNPSQGN
jgi:uncharacterized protein (TIGR02145 family)